VTARLGRCRRTDRHHAHRPHAGTRRPRRDRPGRRRPRPRDGHDGPRVRRGGHRAAGRRTPGGPGPAPRRIGRGQPARAPTPQTTGLIGAAALARMRPHALLVNTARAGVVDGAAVLAALDAGRLRGYAVDVFAPEPPAADDPMLHHPRVLATPHMAAMTTDALDAMAVAVARGVLAHLEGTRT
ncbi:LOW QUALITY PROTEIN: hypothetical protein MCBG_01897, partial [Micromonospora sp. M42]